MRPKPIIGLLGRSGVGKDLAGDYLRLSHGFRTEALAAKVKRMATTYFGWDGDKSEAPLGRPLLVAIGLMFRNEVNPDFWLNQLDWQGRVVITDVRFPNEAEFIHLLGGTVWKIERPTAPKLDNVADNAVGKTESDLTVVNDGTLEAFLGKLDQGIEKFSLQEVPK